MNVDKMRRIYPLNNAYNNVETITKHSKIHSFSTI